MRPLIPGTALSLLFLAGCSPYRIKVDYDRKFDFSGFRSYAWYASSAHAQARKQPVDNPLMDRRVRRAIGDELARRGFRLEIQEACDFLVAYYPIYTRHKVRTTTGFGGMGWGYRPFYGGIHTATTWVHEYREGTLVLEVVDARTHELVYQAAAEGALDEVKTPEEAEGIIQRAVTELLEGFPPGPRPGKDPAAK